MVSTLRFGIYGIIPPPPHTQTDTTPTVAHYECLLCLTHPFQTMIQSQIMVLYYALYLEWSCHCLVGTPFSIIQHIIYP